MSSPLSQTRIEQDSTYEQSLLNDQFNTNTLIESILEQHVETILTIKQNIQRKEEELERDKSLKDLNNLSPRSKRRLMMEKIQSRFQSKEEPPLASQEVVDSQEPERECPFFNITLEEARAIHSDDRFAYRICDLLFLYDAQKLIQDGCVKFQDPNLRNSPLKYIHIPIEVPIFDKDTGELLCNDDLEEVYYTIRDETTLEIFRSLIMEPEPSPPKIRKIETNNPSGEVFIERMNSRMNNLDLHGNDVVNVGGDTEVIVQDLIEDIFGRLDAMGIYYEREAALGLLRDLVENQVISGMNESDVIQNAIATFIE